MSKILWQTRKVPLSFGFMKQTSKLFELVEADIKSRRYGQQPESLYEPIRYIMAIGGKRLRPMLVLLAYSLYKKDFKSVVRYATAVEAFHNFTLMHDDIMDKAPLRRGKPTVHKVWDVNTAILSGDVMLIKVYDQFLDLPSSKLKEALKLLGKCAAEVCEGQQWDMEFEGRLTVSEQEYISMIRQKTAVLLGFSLELGGLLAGAPARDRKYLREFGIQIGIGFQLRDDLLDVFADAKKFGKLAGGDIIANKKTFLLIKAIEHASGKDKSELDRWLTTRRFNKREKVAAVTALYEKLGIRKMTEKKIDQYFQRGFGSLAKVRSKQRIVLGDFASALIDRQV